MTITTADQTLKSGDLVFDIGANKGDMTAHYLSAGAKVVSLEPQAALAKQMNERFFGNENLIVVNKGAGSEKCKMMLNVNSDYSELSTFSQKFMTESRFQSLRWDRTETVEMTTIDDLVQTFGKPVFIKIDVEGFEQSVVEGMSAAYAPLSFEFTAELSSNALAIVERLRSLGYTRFAGIYGHTPNSVLEDWVDADGVPALLGKWCEAHLAWGDLYAC